MNGLNPEPFSDDIDRTPVFRSRTAEIDPADERAWCVDNGATLVALSANELLRAIASGELDIAARVWCEGLEGWTRIRDVPEIAAHFGGFREFGTREACAEAELARLPAVEMAPPAGIAPRAAALDPSQADTPSAVPVAFPVSSGDDFAGRRSSPKPARGGRAVDGDDARWIGGGLFVAAAAIGMALFQSHRAPDRGVLYAEHGLTAVAMTARAAAESLSPAVDRAKLTRSEPGQRRRRGGAGRAPQR